MIFNNIDNETKMEILQENLSVYEKEVYQNLIKLGIDPETFDPETFDKNDLAIDEVDVTSLYIAGSLEKNLKSLDMIRKEINSLGL